MLWGLFLISFISQYRKRFIIRISPDYQKQHRFINPKSSWHVCTRRFLLLLFLWRQLLSTNNLIEFVSFVFSTIIAFFSWFKIVVWVLLGLCIQRERGAVSDSPERRCLWSDCCPHQTTHWGRTKLVYIKGVVHRTQNLIIHTILTTLFYLVCSRLIAIIWQLGEVSDDVFSFVLPINTQHCR